jgi:hypothetical protein
VAADVDALADDDAALLEVASAVEAASSVSVCEAQPVISRVAAMSPTERVVQVRGVMRTRRC